MSGFWVTLTLVVLMILSGGCVPEPKKDSELKYTEASKGIAQNIRMTKSPITGTPKPELQLVAFDRARELLNNKEISQRIKETPWAERGPTNVGGRTRAIMFDPNDPDNKKVWAAGVSGGIWFNDDITSASTEWSVVDDFLANLAVTTMAHDPTDTQAFYAGTGEGWFNIDAVRGAGIFKSSDGGSSWSQLSSTASEFDFVQKIEITDAGTIMAAVRSWTANASGIYRSTDDGISWTRVVNGPGADIEIASDGSIYASTGIFSSGSIHTSDDDGITWSELTGVPGSVERIELAIAPTDPNRIYAAGSSDTDLSWLARTDNGGASWSSLPIPNSIGQDCQPSAEDAGGGQAWYDLILGVDPMNADKAFLGGISLYSTDDAGDNWSQISYWTGFCLPFVHADQHAIVFRPDNPSEALIGNDGGVFYSSDFGSAVMPSFEARNNMYNVTQFYSMALNPTGSSDEMLGGTQDNGSHKFDQGGLNATEEVTGGDGGFCFIDDSPIRITSFLGNQYFLSTNGGNSFTTLSADFEEGLFINPADFDTELDILFAAGNPGFINYYDDLIGSGSKHTLEIGNIGQVTAITVSDRVKGRVYIATESGGLLKIENANSSSHTAFLLSADLPGSNYASSIALGDNEDHIIVSFSNYDVDNVLETRDGGLTWTARDGDLPNMPVRWALVNPGNADEVYLATEVGVWMTTNINVSNPNWIPANDGLANVRTDMFRQRRADGVVGVATHGRGVFTSQLFQSPIADFTLDAPVSYIDKEVNFKDLSTSHLAFWAWEFGDGLTSISQHPSHSYETAGLYSVTLTIASAIDQKSIPNAVHILPKYTPSYLLSSGGDFESNENDFSALSRGGSSFVRGNSVHPGKDGTVSGNSVWVIDPSEESYKSNTEAFLYTPEFDFTNSGDYSMQFQTKYSLESGFDGFVVEYSTTQGESWTKLRNELEASDWYNVSADPGSRQFDTGEPIFSGTTGANFVEKFADLNFLSGEETVAFRFRFISDETVNEAGLAIDDLIINGPDTPQFEANITEICEDQAISFTNLSSGEITSYLWDFGADADPPTASDFGPHDVTYSVAGTKTISLTINGALTETKTDYITVLPNPTEIMVDNENIVVCAEDEFTMNFSGLEPFVEYILVDAADNSELASFSESSPTVDINGLESSTTFLIDATNLSTDCEQRLELSISVTVTPLPEIILELIDGVLTVTEGSSHSWFLDEVLLPNVTNSTFEPDLKGIYTVEVEIDGCNNLSNEVDVTVVSIDDNIESKLRIYPNPSDNLINVEVDENIRSISLISANGEVVDNQSFEMRMTKSAQINVSARLPGIYVLKILTVSGIISSKLIKIQ